MDHRVIYNNNGATGGLVPVDTTPYRAGEPVIVLGEIATQPLVKNGEIFAYWNTAPNGLSVVRVPGKTFNMGSAGVNLYAQWYTTAGLTDGGHGPGVTEHYAFRYDAALAKSPSNPGGAEPARTNALLAVCESDYDLMAGWFKDVKLSVRTPIDVLVANLGGGAGWGPPITLKPGSGGVELLRYLMVSEVSEMMMLAQNAGWYAKPDHNEGSAGEGLSRFLGQQFLVLRGLGVRQPGFAISPSWMNSAIKPVVGNFNYGARQDYVNHTRETDHGIDPATGCAMLFLYYLHTQLGYSIDDIIAAGPGTATPGTADEAIILSAAYKFLTGDDNDPFPFFKQLLDANFPEAKPTVIPGPNPDNPYPLGSWGGLGSLSGCVGDFDGDGIDEVVVGSKWGIGVLKKSGDTMTSIAMAANGTRLGDWLLDTDNNQFGPVADFDFDGRDEIFVRSPWGVGILKLDDGTWSTTMMCANGTDLGGVELDTASDQFGPVFDYDGASYLIFYVTSTGVGSLSVTGGLGVQNFYTIGTDIFGWTLGAFDQFGPVGCFLGSNIQASLRTQFIVTNASGLAVIETTGGEWTTLTSIPNGTTLQGGWVLDTSNNQFLLCGRYQYNPPPMDLILVTSPWGIGTIWFGFDPGNTPAAPTLVTGWLAKNGTDLAGGTLNTMVDRFGPSVYRITGTSDSGHYTEYVPDYVIVTSHLGIRIIGAGVGGELSITTWAVEANGDSLTGWTLDTAHNHFGSAGRYDGGRSEILVTSPWGIGILKIMGSLAPSLPIHISPRTLSAPMVQANGTRLGEWALDTLHNKF